MKQLNQWVVIAVHPTNLKKIPVNPISGKAIDPHNPNNWMSYDQVKQYPKYHTGFVLTRDDPYFFIDIDKCYVQNTGGWSEIALELVNQFPGAFVEVSWSGRGLHIIGRGSIPDDHRCKNPVYGIELYTHSRYLLYTGNGQGNVDIDHSQALQVVQARYFPLRPITTDNSWTSQPVAESTPIEDDSKLLARAKQSIGLGLKCSFKALWDGDVDELSKHYPDNFGTREYDESSADAALAQHLAFWTGKDCDRIKNLMMHSGLYREKYEREDYLIRTITNAVSICRAVYSKNKLKGATQKQRDFGEQIRSKRVLECNDDQKQILLNEPGPQKQASFWIQNKNEPIQTLIDRATPTEDFIIHTDAPIRLSGYQYMPVDRQIDFFKGCVYVQDIHRIFTPNGSLLKQEQFNAIYGGYDFQLTDSSDKVTRKAWQAFTESQAIRFPKAETTCFKPNEESGKIFENAVNVYVDLNVPFKNGDVTPFLNHIDKLFKNEKDRLIILSYMAACIQYQGIKFQWCPLIQGVEGNGKTLLTRCVKFCIGSKYSHMPKAEDLDNKFNGWLLNKIFIGVEDIYVPKDRQSLIETLKPMITGGDGIEIQFKGQDQFTADICANFILNSNHLDAIKKSKNDRRFAIFYTAQQNESDLLRDGMQGSYFPDLYNWLNNGGYLHIHDYLRNFPIPDKYNPATHCHRAPITSSTMDAIRSSLGAVEIEILDATEEGLPGFRNGWINSVSTANLVGAKHRVSSRAVNEAIRNIDYILHPGLNGGRAPTMINGRRPRIYVKKDHYSIIEKDKNKIMEMYLNDNNI